MFKNDKEVVIIHNYEHEIPLVEDIGMRKFLWCDYFHDSIISDISYATTSKKAWGAKDLVTLILYCDRDCEKSYWEFSEKERPADWWDYLKSDQFTYILTFYDVEYFEVKKEKSSLEYLNGRFKDTRIVRELNVNSKRQYYHFRMQITGGYIDIVFRRFKIRKASGRVNYSTKGYTYGETLPWESVNENDLRQPAFPEDEADDWDRFLTMQKLYRSGSPALAEYARECIRSELPIEDAKPYAAYVLGKVGEKRDLDLIRSVYFQTKDELQRRHILDAVEALEAL